MSCPDLALHLVVSCRFSHQLESRLQSEPTFIVTGDKEVTGSPVGLRSALPLALMLPLDRFQVHAVATIRASLLARIAQL